MSARCLASNVPTSVSLFPVLLLVLLTSPAQAEVSARRRLVEDTGFTLRQLEVKLGPGQSAIGLTDRLQLGTFVLANALTFLNGGLKYQLLQEEHLAVAIDVSAGRMLSNLLGFGQGTYEVGGTVASSVILRDNLLLHLVTELRWWALRRLSQGTFDLPLRPLNLFVPSLRATLEWVVTPNHVLFVMLGSPLAWTLGSPVGVCFESAEEASLCSSGAHAFDATYYASAMVGYQLSAGSFNLRLNGGFGPSSGPVGGLDIYWRW